MFHKSALIAISSLLSLNTFSAFAWQYTIPSEAEILEMQRKQDEAQSRLRAVLKENPRISLTCREFSGTHTSEGFVITCTQADTTEEKECL